MLKVGHSSLLYLVAALLLFFSSRAVAGRIPRTLQRYSNVQYSNGRRGLYERNLDIIKQRARNPVRAKRSSAPVIGSTEGVDANAVYFKCPGNYKGIYSNNGDLYGPTLECKYNTITCYYDAISGTFGRAVSNSGSPVTRPSVCGAVQVISPPGTACQTTW